MTMPPHARARLLLAILVTALGSLPAGAQSNEMWRKMNRPAEPFRIVGNIHYVGASDIACYLITTPAGHILVDGGFEETVPLIRAGVEKLGYRLEDVKILLGTHAHIDHVGGLARLAELTGAQVMVGAPDVPALERGGTGDPLLGDEAPFPPVSVDRALTDGDVVELGGVRLTIRLTAGHTAGCISWTTDVTEGDRTLRVASVGSLSVLPGMRFGDPPTYPGIAADYERTFEILRSLEADVFLAPHASFYGMQDKRERLAAGAPQNPFVDPEGLRAFVARGERRFREALEAEQVPTESATSR
jgi:metallo-beta-lactamase class B